MSQLLVNVLSVGPLAPGASVTLAHNLESNDQPVAPKLVIPDRSTSIVAGAITSTTITFTNNGLAADSANFRLERGLSNEVDASTLTTMAWAGGGSAASVVNTSASTFYVDNATGNDANNGLSLSTPKKTIQGAVNAAGALINISTQVPYVVINVAAQTSTEDVIISGPLPAPGTGLTTTGLLILGAAHSVTAGPFTVTATSSTDPDNTTGTTSGATCTITVAGAGWTPNAFRGLFVLGTSGTGSGTYSPIVSNTTDTIEIVRTTTGGNPHAVNSVFNITQPSTVMNGRITIYGGGLGIQFRDLSVIGSTVSNIYTGPGSSINTGTSVTLQRMRLVNTLQNNVMLVNNTNIDTCYIELANNGLTSLFSSRSSFAFSRTYARNYGTFNFTTGAGAFNSTAFEGGTGGSISTTLSQSRDVKFKNLTSDIAFRGGILNAGAATLQRWLFTSSTTTYSHMILDGTTMAGAMQDATFINGLIGVWARTGSSVWFQNTATFSGCVTAITIDAANGVFGTVNILSGVTTGIRVAGGGRFFAGPVAFTATTNPVQLAEASLFNVTSGQTISGTGNAAQPIFRINDGSRLVYSILPTVTGGSSDFLFDGVAIAYAGLPYFGARGSAAAIRS